MSCIRCLYSSAAAIVSRCPPHFVTSVSFSSYSSSSSSVAWKRGMLSAGIRAVVSELQLPGRFGVFRCYAAPRRAGGAAAAAKRAMEKVKPESPPSEEDAFYVVRKGDVIGVFKSLSDCQAQVSSSVCDPSVSVYKGYSLQKETEEYLASRGLKNPLYSIHAADCKEDLFGALVPCPFQQPDERAFSPDNVSKKTSAQKRSKEVAETIDGLGSSGFSLNSTEVPRKQIKLKKPIDGTAAEVAISSHLSCILEFDGASKGNPGKAGAGVIVRKEDGSVVSRLREGLGIVSNNVAEYRAVILGMKYALKKGFKKVLIQGDSLLVCNQVQDLWQTKHQNLIELYKEAKQLKNKFLAFQICHVKREFNSDADAQANLAVTLPSGEVYEEYVER